MCVVSNIGDDWTRRWPTAPYNPWKADPIYIPTVDLEGELPKYIPYVSREEFDILKKEVEALKRLLEAAKKYDEETGQPDCHMDDKIDLIKKIAKIVGVDMDEVFK